MKAETFWCYRADYSDEVAANMSAMSAKGWRPSIHMPRAASRITLTVTAVRTEPLQRIPEVDCLAEGSIPAENPSLGGCVDGGVMVHTDRECVYATPRAWYRELWDKLHGPGSWDANPEVVVLTFTVSTNRE